MNLGMGSPHPISTPPSEKILSTTGDPMERSSKERPPYAVGDTVRCNSASNSGSPSLKTGETYRAVHIRRDGDSDWMTTIDDSSGDRLGEFFASRFDPLTMMATTNEPSFKAGDRVACIDANEATGALVEGAIYYVEEMWEDYGSWKIKVKDSSGKIINRNSGDDWWYARRFAVANSAASPRSFPSAPAINDKTCPHCKNNRCSSTEKSCWKCGGKL